MTTGETTEVCIFTGGARSTPLGYVHVPMCTQVQAAIPGHVELAAPSEGRHSRGFIVIVRSSRTHAPIRCIHASDIFIQPHDLGHMFMFA